jgi:hypothetical protein
MRRAVLFTSCLLALAGCRLPGEHLPVPPLPEDSQPLPYAELLSRARMQAASANESFYIDRWGELDDAAKGLEQTARFLPKATEVPDRLKTSLPKEAEALRQEAVKLREAAKARDVKQSNEVLQRINLKVRELRLLE